MRKLQTSAASEMARMDLAGSPVRVTEFQQYLATTPGEDLPAQALKFILDEVVVPKAKSLIGAYDAVKGKHPGKNDIEGMLFDYRQTNPWFIMQPAKGAEGAAANASPFSNDEIQAELKRRRAGQGQ
jgi:hypothetical protein